ncbi:MAG TPA: hypothetical protein VF058_06770 [Actinomycetota bacterium]
MRTKHDERGRRAGRRGLRWAGLAIALAIVAAPGLAGAVEFSDWTLAQKIDEINGNHPDLNTMSLDGCPIQSPNGLRLYMASNRPGSQALDIWVAKRASTDAPFGEPTNLGAPVNSASDDFCPTPVRGKGLYFVSRRAIPGACGLGDIYFTRFNPRHGWREPVHLGCAPSGPNSALDEQGPSYVEVDGGAQLYFSRSSGAVPGDIFVSTRIGDGAFGPAVAVAELNDATANDIQPNVRKDGREVVFSSNRSGSVENSQDIWVSTRESVSDPWGTPVNLGGNVNTAASESRPSLSWDARQLLFGRAPGPEGMSDIYLSTRERITGSG